MIVQDVVSNVRAMLSDKGGIEYSSEELIQYINYAIIYMNKILIGIEHPDMIKELVVTDNTSIPTDFAKFIGKYPFYPAAGKFKAYNPANSITVRYFANKPEVVSLADTFQFKNEFIPILTYFAAILAGNRNEYDVSQDERLLDRVTQMIVGVAK